MIAGGSASGKTWIAREIAEKFGALLISMDDYYFGEDGVKDGNFDSPDAIDLELLKKNIEGLRGGKDVEKPVYDFSTHNGKGYEKVSPADVIIIEGLFAMNAAFDTVSDMKMFVDASEDIRLLRRLERDMSERGRTKESIIEQWEETVEPMYQIHVLPQKGNADLIILN
jgi:uridine kinase